MLGQNTMFGCLLATPQPPPCRQSHPSCPGDLAASSPSGGECQRCKLSEPRNRVRQPRGEGGSAVDTQSREQPQGASRDPARARRRRPAPRAAVRRIHRARTAHANPGQARPSQTPLAAGASQARTAQPGPPARPGTAAAGAAGRRPLTAASRIVRPLWISRLAGAVSRGCPGCRGSGRRPGRWSGP